MHTSRPLNRGYISWVHGKLSSSPPSTPVSSSTPLNYLNHLRCIRPPHPTHHHTTHTAHDIRHPDTNTTMPYPTFTSPSSSQYFGISIHQGAVDPSTVTSAPPTEVMKHILGVLQGMGVAITEESKFRLRCVRPLRRDSGASDRTTSSEESVCSVSFFLLDHGIRPVPCGPRHYFPGGWLLAITVPPCSRVFRYCF